MIIGWLVSAGFIYALIPGLDFLGALVVAACVTPTDPILAASVVGKGKFAQEHVPSHIRHILQAESGANDGAAFPFLYLVCSGLINRLSCYCFAKNKALEKRLAHGYISSFCWSYLLILDIKLFSEFYLEQLSE